MNEAIFALVLSCGVLIGGERSPQTAIIETDCGTACFEIEIADDHWERAKGLMHRDELGAMQGMLFTYDHPRPVHFWMKNVAFSLDIVFIDHSGLIVGIVEDARPGDVAPIPSPGAVSSVLEIRGGASKRAQIRSGDHVAVSSGHEHPVACIGRPDQVPD